MFSLEQIEKLENEFPGIDLEYFQYKLQTFTYQELVHKLSQTRIYPLKQTCRQDKIQKFNSKLHKILEISQEKNLKKIQKIKELIVQEKSIYEILDKISLDHDDESWTFLGIRNLFSRQNTNLPNDTDNQISDKQMPDGVWFRSDVYLKDSEYLLGLEFSKDFFKKNISQVLKRENSYSKARQVLKKKTRGILESFYFSLPKFTVKENDLSMENSLSVLLDKVGNDELRMEILESVKEYDEKLAKLINKEEYASLSQEISCGCCWEGKTWEELGCCRGGHLFCRDCIVNLVTESIYGSTKVAGKSVKCVYMGGKCQQEIMDLEKFVPQKLMETYTCLLTLKEIEKTGLDLIKCPFCSYAEEYSQDSNFLRKFKLWISKIITYERIKTGLPIAVFVITFLFSTYFQASARNLFFSVFLSVYVKRRLEFVDFRRIVQKIQELTREKTIVFNCKQCLKASCVSCQEEWEVNHECHEKEKSSFRLFVENRMSQALLRTCPNCKISFSKSDGCNKITCPQCKYSMCFICRADIRREKYAHFCNHFRIIPGPCTECKKCDLYIAPENDSVIRKAAQDARIEWISKHPELSRGKIDFSLDSIG